jgi:hypothetical protein
MKENSQHFSIKGTAYIAQVLNTTCKCFWAIKVSLSNSALRYKPEGRWFDPDGVTGYFY